MSYRGDRAVGAIVGGSFRTSVNGYGTTLSGTPSLTTYQRGNATPDTSGMTLNVDVNSVTGLNTWSVDTSSDGTFFVSGDYDVVIAAGTVGGVSVIGEVVGGFSLQSSVTNITQISGDATAADNAEAFFDGTGYAGTNNVIPTVTAVTTVNGMAASAIKDFFDTDSTTNYAGAVAGSVVKEIADNAGGASLTAADIADAVWDEDATGHQTQGTFGQAIGDPGADTDTIFALANTIAGFGAPPSAATIADAVLDEDMTAHQTQGSLGQAIGDPGADTDTIWGLVNTSLDAAVSSRLASASYTAPDNASITSILGDTNELQTDWVNGGRLDNILDARASQTSVDTVDGIVDAILLDTAEIGMAGAGLTALATQASVDIIDGNVDDIEAAVGALNNISTADLDTALAAYDGPTHAEMTAELATADDATLAAIAGLNNISAAQVNAEVDTAIADAALASQASVDSVQADTTQIISDIGGMNDLSAIEVNAEVDAALSDYDGPTHAEMTTELATADDDTLAAIAALNNLSAAEINAEVDTAISDAALASEATVTFIKDQTDKLAFTVTNQIDVNIKSVNDLEVTGSGTGGDPWGPA